MGLWSDRFSTPSVSDLLGEIESPARGLVEKAIALFDTGRGSASASWLGPSWKWSLSLRRDADPVFLIPDPDAPRLAAVIPATYFVEHPPETLPKPVRDALHSTAFVDGRVWVEWRLTGEPLLEGLDAILSRA